MVPNGWENTTLEGLLYAPIRNGYSPNSVEQKTGYVVLGLGALTDNILDTTNIKNVEATEQVLKTQLCHGDFLISRSNTPDKVGRSVMFRGELPNCSYPDLMMKFRADNSLIDPHYLEMYLQSSKTRQYFRSCAAGSSSSMVKITKSVVEKTPILKPPLPEQRKIAKILSTWDKAIDTTEKLIKASKQQKKALMQQLLTGKKRLVNPETGKEFEEEWEEVRLGDISYITTGSSNREDSSLDAKYTFFDRSEDIRTSSRYLFDSEAVIVAGEGQDFVPKHFEGKFDLHQRTYAIVNFKNSFGRFLYYYIGYYRHYFLAQAVGSTVKSLRLPMFQKMPINLPMMGEQQKIASVLTAADREIEVLETKLAHFKQEKKALMQQLLTGKRRVKVEEMEAA